ncbi:MAG TPA: ATP-binding cassette domain-containing protein [Micromonosporaceae bacterium]|nr:ATP-binding cassette domain-containing protein [Micromonosporaceae bacterium]
MTAVLEIQGLRKTYRSLRRGPRRALDGFDMVVEPGQVHGFLGPNGSGKTTTLRTLLGLVRPNGGRMSILGQEVPAALPEVIGRVGAIVESPQFFGNFSGRRTLRLLATAGGVADRRVDEVLELVGLRDRAGERVRTYSLGMKQRLAVASALLKSPELLILDEPANGLDPAGIREMRDMMRGLAASGVTVVLSSHILGEVQQICDSVTIISRGRRVASGPVSQVIAGQDRGEYRVRVEGDPAAAVRVLTAAGARVTGKDDHLVVSDLADPAWVTRTLAAQELWLTELTPLTRDLESVFLELTGTTPEPGHTRQVDEAYRPGNGATGPAPDAHATPDAPAAPTPPAAAAPVAPSAGQERA